MAMERVEQVRGRRERQFYRNRMRGNKERALEADRRLVEENQHLLPVQYRDQVREVLAQETLMEREEMDLEETEELELAQEKQELKAKRKQRLVRGDGVEEEEDMDVDG